jgi:hypothetical protein
MLVFYKKYWGLMTFEYFDVLKCVYSFKFSVLSVFATRDV